MIGYSGKKAKFHLVLMASCLSIAFGVADAHAGFEWVPPQGNPAPDMQKPEPVAPVQQEPLTTQPSAQVHSTPLVVAPPPPETAAPEQSAAAPQGQVTGAPVSIITPASEEPDMQGAYYPTPAAPPPLAQQQPAQQAVIPDAPAGKLVINPFPPSSPTAAAVPGTAVKTQVYTPPPTPAPNSIVYGDAVGFGTDMPLPLALNQVVPAGYAYSFVDGVNIGARVSWDGGQPWNVVLQNMLAPLNLEAVITGKAVVIRPIGLQRLSQSEMKAAALPQSPQIGMSAKPATQQPAPDQQLRRNAIADPGKGPMLPMYEG